MSLLYNIGIRLYYFLICVIAAFNTKARRWVNGRRHQKVLPISESGSVWFHFASLGEFEQGRPVLEKLRQQYSEQKFVITFFSPSGYEIRKNTPLADAVYYLPLDTAANARNFVNAIRPQFAVFTKYEYWYHFFNELHQQHIPLYLISGIFRPNQIFFKWYGSLHRKMLTQISQLFVQDEASKQLLADIHIQHVQVSGDTRFDRVWANATAPKSLPLIQEFKGGKNLFIAGSTWPQDEALLAQVVNQYTDWKFIIAPHEVEESKIAALLQQLPANETVRFSEAVNSPETIFNDRVLVIDNIGMLSSLYQYAEIAYIGGGFGAGIHNTLEAAAFGLPVIFGPQYQKFREARELITTKAGFSISTAEELKQITQQLTEHPESRLQAGAIAKQYVKENTGATEMIVHYIDQQVNV